VALVSKPKKTDMGLFAVLVEKDSIGVHKTLMQGLPYSALTKFELESGLERKQLATLLAVGPRTLDRRQKQKKLQPEESDRLYRIASLYRSALELFNGDRDATIRWMAAPRPALSGETPLELARTEVGAKRVETLIRQLERGVYV